jgi:hypothetical protein
VDENRKKQEIESIEHRQKMKIEMELAREEAIESKDLKIK